MLCCEPLNSTPSRRRHRFIHACNPAAFLLVDGLRADPNCLFKLGHLGLVAECALRHTLELPLQLGHKEQRERGRRGSIAKRAVDSAEVGVALECHGEVQGNYSTVDGVQWRTRWSQYSRRRHRSTQSARLGQEGSRRATRPSLTVTSPRTGYHIWTGSTEKSQHSFVDLGMRPLQRGGQYHGVHVAQDLPAPCDLCPHPSQSVVSSWPSASFFSSLLILNNNVDSYHSF